MNFKIILRMSKTLLTSIGGYYHDTIQIQEPLQHNSFHFFKAPCLVKSSRFGKLNT